MTCDQLMEFFEQARTYVKKRLPERRKGGRLALSVPARILVAGDPTASLVQVTVCNVSIKGMALLVSRPMTNGMEFCVRLMNADNRPRWIRCSVRRWQASPNGACQVGAQFCDLVCTDVGEIPVFLDPASPALIADRELAPLLKVLAAFEETRPSQAPTVKPGGKDNRTARRVPFRFFSSATLIDKNRRVRPIRILLQNISTCGVGFRSSVALAGTDRIAFTLTLVNKKTKSVLARVVRNMPVASDQFLVGAELLEACDPTPREPGLPQRWLASA